MQQLNLYEQLFRLNVRLQFTDADKDEGGLLRTLDEIASYMLCLCESKNSLAMQKVSHFRSNRKGSKKLRETAQLILSIVLPSTGSNARRS